jgi:predicted glycoside hydrolase/deacetylase ChbG (UPF0249 family)
LDQLLGRENDKLSTSLASHLLTIPLSFVINYNLVFSFSNLSKFSQVIRFTIASLLYLIIHFLLFYGFDKYIHLELLNHITTTIVSSLINFCILKLFVFKVINRENKFNSNRIKIILHADDFGISREISKNILDCVMIGSINRVSIICNTDHNNKKYLSLNKGLHLNLVEGKPISNRKEIRSLINAYGEFKFSFLSYILQYYFSSSKKKQIFKRELSLEIENQIKRYIDLYAIRDIHIDGHTHIHILPFILDIILQLKDKYNIQSIRLPKEKFYFGGPYKNYFSSNLIKHIILNFLSYLQINKIRTAGLRYNDYFIGVLSSGSMTIKSLTKALAVLIKKRQNMVIEVLFHPGFVNDKREINWTKNDDYLKYYSDLKREKEKKVLLSEEYKELIQHFQLISKL